MIAIPKAPVVKRILGLLPPMSHNLIGGGALAYGAALGARGPARGAAEDEHENNQEYAQGHYPAARAVLVGVSDFYEAVDEGEHCE